MKGEQGLSFTCQTGAMVSVMLPPVNQDLDETYYFAQYVQYYDNVCAEASHGHIQEATDDVCFLCKDGGDLVECDHGVNKHPLHSSKGGEPTKKRSRTHGHGKRRSAAHRKNQNSTVTAVGGCGGRCACKKVYHAYCLSFAMGEDEEDWLCPRHFCDICGATDLK